MVMKKYCIIVALVLVGCGSPYFPKNYFLSEKEKENRVNFLLPYVLPKAENTNFEDRFKDSSKEFYKIQAANDSLFLHSYYVDPKDSLHYFMVQRKDRKSLYTDYRAIAGLYKIKNGVPVEIELKFLTPMMRKDTIMLKAPFLFNELVTKGTVAKYIGNREYIDWPSQDVFYNKEENKWQLKADSEWAKVMKEAQKID
jgi:hypothetical protein